MTEAQHEKAYTKLARKLELTEQSSDDVAHLEDALEEAEGALLLYLRWDEMKDVLIAKLVELAALYYRRDTAGVTSGGVKSSSYTEDKISQSETYLTTGDYATAEQDILAGLARYREVRMR